MQHMIVTELTLILVDRALGSMIQMAFTARKVERPRAVTACHRIWETESLFTRVEMNVMEKSAVQARRVVTSSWIKYPVCPPKSSKINKPVVVKEKALDTQK